MTEEHTKKNWLLGSMETQGGRPFLPSCSDYEKKKICFKNGTIEVCKKILEEMENRALSSVSAATLRNIFKDLGIEL